MLKLYRKKSLLWFLYLLVLVFLYNFIFGTNNPLSCIYLQTYILSILRLITPIILSLIIIRIGYVYLTDISNTIANHFHTTSLVIEYVKAETENSRIKIEWTNKILTHKNISYNKNISIMELLSMKCFTPPDI